jgi:hypothetical protein
MPLISDRFTASASLVAFLPIDGSSGPLSSSDGVQRVIKALQLEQLGVLQLERRTTSDFDDRLVGHGKRCSLNGGEYRQEHGGGAPGIEALVRGTGLDEGVARLVVPGLAASVTTSSWPSRT